MLEQLEIKDKVKLTVPLIVTYLNEGYNRHQIAKICNLSHHAVYDYCDRHYDTMAPLLNGRGALLHMNKVQHMANRYLDEAEKVVDATADFNKKDLVSLNTGFGIFTDKARLLKGESTSNISVDDLDSTVISLDAEEYKIKQALGMGNDNDITGVNGEPTP